MERALAVVAAGTGEGKTSVALGLARLLADAGYRVAPFKCGPDYLDARLYEAACGRGARNLDLWLDGPQQVRRNALRAAETGDVLLLEGMMGLFDGDDDGATSTAQILRVLDVPALLVLDGWRASQSLAAIALGCTRMTPRVRILGAVLNRAGGEGHVRAVRRACERVGVPVLAVLPHEPAWRIPERRLGLQTGRLEAVRTIAAAIAVTLRDQLDLDALVGRPRRSETTAGGREISGEADGSGPLIAIARDEALWFTYPETVEALRAAGARIVFFSPLRDRALPDGTRGLWLSGGYPESHASALAANASLRAQVAEAVASGMPVYAECGGMMWLAEELETAEGCFPMVGALRGRTSIARPRLHLGYRRVRAVCDSVLDRAGDGIRAYEFHYASASLRERPAYEGEGDAGAWRERLVAGFLHRRFFEGDAASCRFVAACAR